MLASLKYLFAGMENPVKLNNNSDMTHELFLHYLKWDGEFIIIILALNLLF